MLWIPLQVSRGHQLPVPVQQGSPRKLTGNVLQSESPRLQTEAVKGLERQLTGHCALFFLTVSWASIFGVWSGLFAAVYFLFLLGIRSGEFYRTLDEYRVWRRG
ncbi:hypothetical protein A9D60_17360 [Leisingera sp. JC1]|nr:hypothetical protein A9D60_17360 [Leisingera sp. JC1]